MGQGQPSIIIWANLVVLEHPMMYTKFRGHQPFGFREKDFFFKVFTIYGHGGHLGKWPGPFEQTFVPPSHRSSIWNLTLIGPVISQEMFKLKSVDKDGQRRRPTYPISSPNEPSARELKKNLWKQGNHTWYEYTRLWFTKSLFMNSGV